MTEGHEERFIPERQAIDPLAVVKDYATVPRLEYRYVTFLTNRFWVGRGAVVVDDGDERSSPWQPRRALYSAACSPRLMAYSLR
jgi:hypothetical protein